MTLRDLYYNYTGYPNVYEDGGIVGRPNGVQLIPIKTAGISPQGVPNSGSNGGGGSKFLNFMNGGGGTPWGSIISAAGTNIANAFLDTEASTAERVAGAMGIPALANQWRADTSKGDAYIKDMQNSMDLNSKNYIQDASSSWGGANAVKQNLKTNISPISFNSAVPSLKDFKGNWWKNMGASVAQGAASGSVGGPWGALGGAVTGLFGSIGGLFGRKGRAERAYKDFLAKRNTLVSAQEAAYNRAVTDQTLSNMQALANGNTQQRINDMANIRAYGGNLYPIGGTIKEGDEEAAQEPVYEGGELPEITVNAESMPWYEKAWKSYKRNIINPLIQLPRRMTSLDAQYAESYDKDYFTFDEAYKDARNKGQKTFFWNNNYYNTDYEGSHGKQYKQDVASGKAANWEQTYPNYTNPELRREKQEELDAYGITNEQTKNKTPFDMLFRKVPARGYNLNDAISKMVGEFNIYDEFNNEEDLRASLLKKYPEFNSTDIPIKTLSNGNLSIGNVTRPVNMSDEMWKAFSDDVTSWNMYSGGEAVPELHRGEYDYLLGFPNKSNSDYTGNVKISKYKTGSLPYYYTTSKIEESEPFISDSDINKYNTYYNNAMARIEELESKKKFPNREKWQRDKANGIINMDRADADKMDELLNMKYEKEIDKIFGDISAKRDDFINKYYDDENFRTKWENNGVYINEGNLDFLDWAKVSKLPEKDLKLLGDIGFLQNIPKIPELKSGNHLAKSSDTDYYIHENDYNNGKYEKYIQFIKNKFTNNNDHNKYHKESVDLRDLINAGALGTYTLGVPKDNSYISVWDKFDIDPFGSGNDSPVIKIGNPYEYYTRFYRKGTEPNIDSLYNNLSNTRAMGGNLYTDLSPNMINLWNNKQQIDQQKVNTQQMNFGLGNSFNYKNMFPDGGIIPPNRPLTREELDKLTPAEKEEYAKKQIIRLYKEVAAPSSALHDSREEDDEHTYNVLNRPDQNPYSSFNVFGNLFKPSNSGYIFTERDKRKEAAEKAQQHSGSAGGWGGKLPDEYIDKMINAPDKSWVDYEEEKKNGKKYETPENPTPSANVFNTILGWFGYDNTNKDKIYDENNKFYANGGQLSSSDLPDNAQYYANGGTHEENPYGGIQVGVDQQGNPNLVEEGEFRWGDYIFSDRINVDPTLLSRYNLAPATKHQGKKANKGKLSYADMAKKYAKKNNELANDPIGKNTLDAYMRRLQDAQEDQKFQDSIEQQKQDAINQYRRTLSTPTQGNPMYGAMKYNGMGNAATQQGVNAGMSDLGQQSGGNEVLSNTNRSGNNMLHALGGNLYWRGSFLKKDPPPYGDPNSRIDYAMNYVGTPTYNGNSRIDFVNQYITDADKTNDYGVSDFMNRIYSGNVGFGSPKVNTTVAQTQTPQNFQEWALWQHDNGNKPYVGSANTNVEPDAFALQAQGKTADGSTVDADYTTGYNGTTNTNTNRSSLTGNINTGNTTTGTYATNAFKEDREGVPLYSTAGKFATFGKGLTPMLYDWMNKTNTKYDPNQRPANELVDMGNNSTFLRTADTIGGYRAPNLMDAERMNNAAQAQGLAALQSALSVGNGNRGFAAAQANQQMYNTGMGIGNNYATAQQANNEERYKTDAYNTAIDQFNANARNTSYQDNQRAEQVGQQMALSAKQAANDYLQKENWYADRTNRTAMDNRATNQAAWTDNALNYFITQAQENAERNRQNNDITKRYWSDKDGVMHYIGDSGLNGKIREYFRRNNIDNGTFTGDRLAAFNSIIQNNKAKDVANEKGELWSTVQGLMDDEIAARNKEIADAKKKDADELQEYRDQFDSELAQLQRYGSDKMYGDYWRNQADLDYYSGATGKFKRDEQSLSQLRNAITKLKGYNKRYNKWTPQNVAAYGGYINNGNKNNKNGYYTYTY